MDIVLNPMLMPRFQSRHVLSIYSNDIASPVLEVVVYADPEPEFSLDPETVDFGVVERQAGRREVVWIRQIMDRTEPLDIKSAEVLPPQSGIDAAVERVPEEEWERPGWPEFRIALDIRPTAPVGPISAYLSFVPNIQRMPSMHVPLTGEIASFYRLHGHLERAARVPAGGVAEGIYEITANAPIDVVDIDTTAEGVAVVVRRGESSHELFLDLHADADAQPGLLNSVLSVTLQSGEKQAVETLPLRVGIVSPERAAEDVRILEP